MRNRPTATILDSVLISNSWTRRAESGDVVVKLIGNDPWQQFIDAIDGVLGDASDESLLSVMIGRENPVEGLQTTSLVSSGYGSGGETLAKLAVLGPTRMDYPGTMGAVSAVARYVGEILMES